MLKGYFDPLGNAHRVLEPPPNYILFIGYVPMKNPDKKACNPKKARGPEQSSAQYISTNGYTRRVAVL
jgi:hypothetical protein